jgi:hypothetical protein
MSGVIIAAPDVLSSAPVSVLITGAFGRIGAWVVRALLAEGERPDVARVFTAAARWRRQGARIEQPIPFPDALDDARCQGDLGPAPASPLEQGGGRTPGEVARLHDEGRLDARELG